MFGVTLNTYVWTEGMKDWDMVKNVRDLASVFPIPVEKEHVNPIPSDNTSKSSNNQMGTQVDEVIEVPKYEEKSAIGWLIAIYIFAALGGFLGIVFGISTYMAKEKVYNSLLGDYEKVPRYKKNASYIGIDRCSSFYCFHNCVASCINVMIYKLYLL